MLVLQPADYYGRMRAEPFGISNDCIMGKVSASDDFFFLSRAKQHSRGKCISLGLFLFLEIAILYIFKKYVFPSVQEDMAYFVEKRKPEYIIPVAPSG